MKCSVLALWRCGLHGLYHVVAKATDSESRRIRFRSALSRGDGKPGDDLREPRWRLPAYSSIYYGTTDMTDTIPVSPGFNWTRIVSKADCIHDVRWGLARHGDFAGNQEELELGPDDRAGEALRDAMRLLVGVVWTRQIVWVIRHRC